MKITIDRSTAEQWLEALEGKRYTACGWKTDCDKAIATLRAALAEPPMGKASTDVGVPVYVVKKAEPQEPASLKRGTTGRCTRKVCECEKEGLGLECIHLEPVVDGYPLWSGIPKAEPSQEPVQEPQRKPLSVTDLQDALVYTCLIDRDAIEDPEGYDTGSTVAQINALHEILTRKPT